MHIVHISSELSPIAKVGGLGDVIHGLSKEFMRQGHTVQIIIPKYDCIEYNLLKNLKVHYRDLWSYEGPYLYNNTIWSADVDGLSILLVEPHHPNYFFSRGNIYGCHDDIDRFLYFSRAVMEYLFKSGTMPDIIHVHDWPTAVIPTLLQDMYIPLGINPCKTILTLHNLEHQGHCAPKNLTQIGLRGEDYLSPNKFQDPANLFSINLLKGGIEYATAITTVSPSYEKEIQTEPGSHGLHLVLSKHSKKIKGILNGIDEDFWNPEKDSHLQEPFPAHLPLTSERWKLTQAGKAQNKKHLRALLGLEDNASPLVACITRLVHQKSPLLIESAFRHILDAGAQCIILGSAYSEEIKTLFLDLQSEYKKSIQGRVILDYNEALSHLIYAGSDMLIIPSLFEPCGLTQLISLRYGSIPIVRKTGGLGDTIFDIETSSHPKKDRNGFVFNEPSKEALNLAIDRALALWKEDPKKWQDLMKQGMTKDFSWKSSAQAYLKLYQEIT